jgi:hypothetical protein
MPRLNDPSEDPTQGRRVGHDPDEDATQGREVGEDPYEDPTQGRRVGHDPDEDPTQGREVGEDPYDDPTQGREISSDPYEDPTRGRWAELTGLEARPNLAPLSTAIGFSPAAAISSPRPRPAALASVDSAWVELGARADTHVGKTSRKSYSDGA